METLITLIVLGLLIVFNKPIYDLAIGVWALLILGIVFVFAFIFMKALVFEG